MPASRDDVHAGFHRILAASGVPYRLYQHKAVLSYDDAREVSAELGLHGLEGKVVVCRAGEGYAVYVTTEGQRFDARALKRLLGLSGDALRRILDRLTNPLFEAEPAL